MKWILYIMLFSTPAANITNKADLQCLDKKNKDISVITDCRRNFESRHVWSLQTTSQMEFSDVQGCVITRNTMKIDTNVASTMTIRTWCICDDPNGKCPTDQQLAQAFETHRKCESTGATSCLVETKKTFEGYLTSPTQHNNFSIIRLDPP